MAMGLQNGDKTFRALTNELVYNCDDQFIVPHHDGILIS